MRLILLCGHKGSGKSTVANEIRGQLGSVATLAFADSAKEFLQLTCEIKEDVLWGPSSGRAVALDLDWEGARSRARRHGPGWVATLFPLERQEQSLSALYAFFDNQSGPMTCRVLLQEFLTGWARTVDPEVWVRRMKHAIASYRHTSVFAAAVIHDGRHLNEVTGMKALGAEVWYLEGREVSEDPHSSETEVLKCKPLATHILDNRLPLTTLPERVRSALLRRHATCKARPR